uniref:Post-GPI attachment to proteins factor 2-like n=1 Tax=Cacopsylla melanoneura TaxID=428564 RepID=A0A8D8SQE3_9HEMI
MEESETSKKEEPGDEIILYYALPLRKLACMVVSLPLAALVLCFISSIIFQFDSVHETHCKVYNIIPSISAVTGVSPQRYLWRTSIALHLAPRYLIAIVYNVQMSAILWQHKVIVSISFWLSIVEVSSLAGTTYISNLDNFPLHEKLFIVFMLSSLFYMLVMSLSLSLFISSQGI